MAKFLKPSQTVNNVYTGDANFVHDQGQASATWTVTHNLNKYCSAAVVDTAGTVVIGQITYNSLNQITLTFQSGFAGKAYFN
jgi:hypothetical protein|tara:strand:- start:307 stop:552 length:246 start_codon:yes stop_codon:yes gene_type:complete